MPNADRAQLTMLIDHAAKGDSNAAADLLPLIYEELRKLAASNMNKEDGRGAGHTLQPTALVHEAYMRLLGPEGDGASGWNSRGHFFGAAAIAMRRILIERARGRGRVKRGGDRTRVDLNDDAVAGAPDSDTRSDELLALDEALTRLEALDGRKARVVMLRYFAGLSIEQTAAALEVSIATVKTDWAFARAWLSREIEKAQEA
ncbi:ECF-type sigma factor [Synechococcus sp. Cruz CV-v-12]|uniref:ECF-type sigma factor n=1 Tax=Synechococcus sp. Cruz CV-v-12 TaxID=2823728 RepID=UPI0020CF5735|nr:ECF-type sigma factor [Synechococcus sp. Cruz CV-v-12]MCP9874702.1 sigma-70 family RNA polymerase sigma factor [Synechococcus sp. Cruz CV-v-12]